VTVWLGEHSGLFVPLAARVLALGVLGPAICVPGTC